MARVRFAGVLFVAVVASSSASAEYLWFENFEGGPSGWSFWTEQGSNYSWPGTEQPAMGDIQPYSGSNGQNLYVGGSQSFAGGVWTVVGGLPMNTDLAIDGYWRDHFDFTGPGDSWAEVILLEGNNPPVNGSGLQGAPVWRADSSGNDYEWDGLISATSDSGLGNPFQTASGTVTIVLKTGNVGLEYAGTYFDDVYITPEPTTLLLLALGGLEALRRRR